MSKRQPYSSQACEQLFLSVCQMAGQRAIQWYLDTGDCFFCLVNDDELHEEHCELGLLFGSYKEE